MRASIALIMTATAVLVDQPAAPQLFEPGVISTGEYETHPCFAPDGKTLYFLRSKPNFTAWTIMQSDRGDERWAPPRVAPFSGKHQDADPFITSDGTRFYFISDRPDPRDPARQHGMDIWMMQRADGGWSEPQRLAAPVNSDGNEWFPTIADDGTIYFGSDRAGGRGATDLYRCRFVDGKYQPAENLGESVNSPADEFEPLVAPDQSWIIFMASGREDAIGGGDLYISFNRDGQWTPARNLGEPINSRAQEIGAHRSRDGTWLYYGSARRIKSNGPAARAKSADELIGRGPGNGLGDIYRIPLEPLIDRAR